MGPDGGTVRIRAWQGTRYGDTLFVRGHADGPFLDLSSDLKFDDLSALCVHYGDENAQREEVPCDEMELLYDLHAQDKLNCMGRSQFLAALKISHPRYISDLMDRVDVGSACSVKCIHPYVTVNHGHVFLFDQPYQAATALHYAYFTGAPCNIRCVLDWRSWSEENQAHTMKALCHALTDHDPEDVRERKSPLIDGLCTLALLTKHYAAQPRAYRWVTLPMVLARLFDLCQPTSPWAKHYGMRIPYSVFLVCPLLGETLHTIVKHIPAKIKKHVQSALFGYDNVLIEHGASRAHFTEHTKTFLRANLPIPYVSREPAWPPEAASLHKAVYSSHGNDETDTPLCSICLETCESVAASESVALNLLQCGHVLCSFCHFSGNRLMCTTCNTHYRRVVEEDVLLCSSFDQVLGRGEISNPCLLLKAC